MMAVLPLAVTLGFGPCTMRCQSAAQKTYVSTIGSVAYEIAKIASDQS